MGGSNPQIGMFSGMIEGMARDNLKKIPAETLKNVLVFCRDQLEEWIGDEYTEADDVPDTGHDETEKNDSEE